MPHRNTAVGAFIGIIVLLFIAAAVTPEINNLIQTSDVQTVSDSSFDDGTFFNTETNADGNVILSTGETDGNYTSDAKTAGAINWDDFTVFVRIFNASTPGSSVTAHFEVSDDGFTTVKDSAQFSAVNGSNTFDVSAVQQGDDVRGFFFINRSDTGVQSPELHNWTATGNLTDRGGFAVYKAIILLIFVLGMAVAILKATGFEIDF